MYTLIGIYWRNTSILYYLLQFILEKEHLYYVKTKVSFDSWKSIGNKMSQTRHWGNLKLDISDENGLVIFLYFGHFKSCL